MTSIGSGSEWKPQVPPEAHRNKAAHQSRPANPIGKHDASSSFSSSISSSISSSLGDSFSSEGTSPPALRGRLGHTHEHIKEVSELFKSSLVLKQASAKQPLIPYNADSEDDIQGNANDVYMTHFHTTQKNLDVVFKPGAAAAMRSKICFGLTKLFQRLENVIVAAKEGQATVVSRDDYGVKRVKVYNPEAKKAYLIDKDQMEELVNLSGKKRQGKCFVGMVGKQEVELVPVPDMTVFIECA